MKCVAPAAMSSIKVATGLNTLGHADKPKMATSTAHSPVAINPRKRIPCQPETSGKAYNSRHSAKLPTSVSHKATTKVSAASDHVAEEKFEVCDVCELPEETVSAIKNALNP